jgi:hypothetical protein
MDLVSGFLLWMGDVLGVKWVRNEKNQLKKAVKAISFLIIGVFLLILFMVFWYG